MISTLKETESGSGNDVDSAELSLYMMQVIKELNDERKLPAVHVYLCTLPLSFSFNVEIRSDYFKSAPRHGAQTQN